MAVVINSLISDMHEHFKIGEHFRILEGHLLLLVIISEDFGRNRERYKIVNGSRSLHKRITHLNHDLK